jgi:hypothetical protein
MTWTTSLGKPAACRAVTNRSPVRGVWGEGFRMTELPDISAGRTELMEVKYG